jgi:maleamate amidohydrolase
LAKIARSEIILPLGPPARHDPRTAAVARRQGARLRIEQENKNMSGNFEDHCWRDIVSTDDLEIYSHYRRRTFVGPAPALVAIDLYELAYRGGPKLPIELVKTNPSGCGRYATKRVKASVDAADYTIRPDFQPQKGDVVITKQRASAFYGTPLAAHLTQLGVQTVIVCGESTSGCVRASAVDAYSHGYHVVLAEECCFDRSLMSHKVNLFDMHHKYADVMHVDEIIAHLSQTPAIKRAS